jgi:NAD+ synthase|tara:strand:- start:2190 stop:2972 length:783 start_codon:yes stop_codon:yes gene_type:complete
MSEDILNEIKNLNYAEIIKSIQIGIIQKCNNYNKNGVIFGLSGGIDSGVIAYLCAKSMKEKTLALIMPDSKISPKEETEDAIKIVDTLGINYKLIDINSIHKEYYNVLEPNDLALGNLRARIRKNLLYYYANSKNLLVLGSSDKSEFNIGYFTKFGDGAADLLPIVSLYKTQIRQIAKELGLPNNIITKKSSPNLWPNHVAESEIGATYDEIDCILYCIIDKKLSVDETVSQTKIESETVEKIYQLYKKSEHKRITPEHL